MTPLHCVFTLSLFWWPEPLKYINGWVFLLKGLGLQRTTLWASGSFWRRSQLLLINWRAPVTGTIFLSISAQGDGPGHWAPNWPSWESDHFCHSRGAPTDIWGSVVIIHCREEECIGKYAPWGNLEGQGVQIANSSRLEVVYCHSFFQSGSELKITPPSSRVVLTVYKFNTFPLFKKERFFLSNRGPPTDPLEEVMTFSCPWGSQLPTDPFRCLDYASVDLYLINSARLVSLFWAWKYWVWATDFRQYWSRLWMPKPKDHDVTACSGSTQVMF